MHNITIETERLILRPLTAADAEEVFEWVSDERVAKYMSYTTYKSIEQVVDLLKSFEVESTNCYFIVIRRSDEKAIGSCNIGVDSKDDGFWGFGYNFRYDCWGNGYATETVKAMLKYVYDNLGARKFTASHAEPNKASGRVMEKCGLHFVGYGEFKKLDGSCKMRSIVYEGEL